jgi:hypothetical protein
MVVVGIQIISFTMTKFRQAFSGVASNVKHNDIWALERIKQNVKQITDLTTQARTLYKLAGKFEAYQMCSNNSGQFIEVLTA